MDLFVKRSRHKTFEKGAILFDKVEEWTALTSALEYAIEVQKDFIEKFESYLDNNYTEENNEDLIKSIEDCQSRVYFLEGLKKQLSYKNEMSYSEVKF